MRKFMTIFGVGVTALLLILGSTPARAGQLSWDDAVGDPTTLAQGTWDITKVTLSFDGARFTARIKVAALGDPAPFGTGQHFAVRFNFDESQYTLRLTQDRVTGETFTFQQDAGQSQVATIACRTCKYELDTKNSEVVMHIGFDSLKSAARKLAPGQSIDGITAFAGASYSEPSGTFGTLLWGGGTPGDTAPPPDGATFTF